MQTKPCRKDEIKTPDDHIGLSLGQVRCEEGVYRVVTDGGRLSNVRLLSIGNDCSTDPNPVIAYNIKTRKLYARYDSIWRQYLYIKTDEEVYMDIF